VPEDAPIFKHKATADFWFHYRLQPPEIQALADKNYSLLKNSPRHPSLQFKKVGKVWSIRIGLNHRALSIQIPEGFLWFWIGEHDDYDRKI